MQNDFSCKHLNECGGCPIGQIPYALQKERKINLVQEAFPDTPVKFHSVATSRFRERADFVIIDGKFNLFSRRNEAGQFYNVPIDSCLQLSSKVQDFFDLINGLSWPIQKGSIRLRVSPDVKWNSYRYGLWMDFANKDIKYLLEDQILLEKLINLGVFIEVGQKHKALRASNTSKLDPAQLHCWGMTAIEDQMIPLYSCVGSFSQPGWAGNKIIISIFESLLKQIGSQKILEFGSGAGNLTFPLAGKERKVIACEIDELATQGLRKTLDSEISQRLNLQDRIDIKVGNFHKMQSRVLFQSIDTIVVNPPRSGIGDFLRSLREVSIDSRPSHIIYMSCFLESMKEDANLLGDLNYKLINLDLIDQFPQSHHFELIGLWCKDPSILTKKESKRL